MWSTNLDTLLDRNARFWAPAFASRWCIPASLLLGAAMRWVLDVIRFSIRYVQIMTLGVLAPCLGSALLAGITIARRKRQEGA